MVKRKSKKRAQDLRKPPEVNNVRAKSNSGTDSASETDQIFEPSLADSVRAHDPDSVSSTGAIPKVFENPDAGSIEPNQPLYRKRSNPCDPVPPDFEDNSCLYKSGQLDYESRNKSDPPIEPVCGLPKFYANEFEAFYKYFVAIHKPSEKSTLNYLVESVKLLPDEPSCTMGAINDLYIGEASIINFTHPPVVGINKNIEFAHPSLQLEENESKGRLLVSTASLKQNTVLISEKASVFQIIPRCICEFKTTDTFECHHCGFRMFRYYRCPKCSIVAFCSLKCRNTSLKNYHQYECEGFQRHFWDMKLSDFSYLALRMVLYGAQYGFQTSVPKKNKKWGRPENCNNYPFIHRLESHFDRIPVMKVYEVLRKAAKTVIYLMTRTKFFDNVPVNIFWIGGLLVKHYFQAQMNCVNIKYRNITFSDTFSLGGIRAKTICPTIAMLNHSCSPNAVIVGCGDQIIVKSIKEIHADEEITISYYPMNQTMSLENRHMLMKSFFYFSTVCKCRFCRMQILLDERSFVCWKCAAETVKSDFYDFSKPESECSTCIASRDNYQSFEDTCIELFENFTIVGVSKFMRQRLINENDPGFCPFLTLHVCNRMLLDQMSAISGHELLGNIFLGQYVFDTYRRLVPRNAEYMIEIRMVYFLNLISEAFEELDLSAEFGGKGVKSGKLDVSPADCLRELYCSRQLIEKLLVDVKEALNDLLIYVPRELIADYESLLVPPIERLLRRCPLKEKWAKARQR